MAVNGFLVNDEVQKYNYESLENYNTPDFSSSSTYQVGDYVMYQGKLYKCITEITTSGGWDSSKWSLAILSDDVANLRSSVESGEYGLSEPVKQALLQIARKIAYIDDQGQTYYDDLYYALYPLHVVSISTVYTQSGVVYGNDTLESLKADLVVTAVYSDSSTQTVPAADYTLSGTLTDGSSTITVSYGGKTTTFDVVVTWIPSAYQEAEYLESTGTQYITTDLLSQLPMGMECRVAPTVENSGQFAGSGVSSDGNSRFFLGGVVVEKTDSTINYFAVRASDSSSGYTPGDGQWTGGNWVKALPELVINDIYTVVSGIESDGTQHIQVDDYTESRLTKKIPTVGYPFYFMYSSNVATPSNIRIYYAKLFTGSTLLFYGIPCYRKSDNAGGLYDLVSNKFYGNSGTGSFVLGQNVIRG